MPTKDLARIGPYFLKPRGKKGIYSIFWYDPTTRQTPGISTGTSDYQEAQLALARHALAADRPVGLLDAPLATVLTRYWNDRGSALTSAEVVRVSMANALEIWGDVTVAQLLPSLQEKFVAKLRADGLSDHTILSRLGRIWTAINYAKAEGVLQMVPTMITSDRWKPNLQSGGRELSVAELGKLFNTAGKLDFKAPGGNGASVTYSREHWWRFLILAVGTGHRRTALMELTKAQVDLDSNVIRLNPEGRRQTKKRRPTVPMCPTLRYWAQKWHRDSSDSDYIITYGSMPLVSDTFFDTLSEAAGVACSANDIRHTVTTWMVRKRVPGDERRMFIGHKAPGAGVDENYIHLDPDFCATAASAVEELFRAIAPLCETRDLLGDSVEREKGLEPSASSLARTRSTN